MYRRLGFSVADVAKFLQVTPRTVHSWISGRARIPFSAYKLLRLQLRYELPGEAWRGWHITAGRLYTPEGHELNPADFSWWSLLVRRAAMFSSVYRDLVRHEARARTAREPGVRSVPAPGLDASRARGEAEGAERPSPGLVPYKTSRQNWSSGLSRTPGKSTLCSDITASLDPGHPASVRSQSDQEVISPCAHTPCASKTSWPTPHVPMPTASGSASTPSLQSLSTRTFMATPGHPSQHPGDPLLLDPSRPNPPSWPTLIPPGPLPTATTPTRRTGATSTSLSSGPGETRTGCRQTASVTPTPLQASPTPMTCRQKSSEPSKTPIGETTSARRRSSSASRTSPTDPGSRGHHA